MLKERRTKAMTEEESLAAVEEFARAAELAEPDAALFYSPGEEGYTDYPLEG